MKKRKKFREDNTGNTEIVISDLRALLYWAAIGVHSWKGGSYQRDIENIINSYADFLNFKLPKTPKFKR